MEKLKLMTIVGTRPEIIRLSSTIKACDQYFNQILVHTGQNYDYTLNQIFFDDLELRQPDHYLEAVGSNLGETMGNIIAKTYDVLLREQPDALLILGDKIGRATSELQSHSDLVCRLLLEKKKYQPH